MEEKFLTPPKPELWSKAVFIIACFCGLGIVVVSIWLAAHNVIPTGTPNPPQYAAYSSEQTAVPVYKFAIHPLHNPQRLFSNFQPLVDIINDKIKDFQIHLLAGRDYGSFEKSLLAGEYDFALANPFQALASISNGYNLAGKMGDDENFCGLIVSRSEIKLDSPADLAGKTLIYPSPTALAATLMPRLFLKTHGLDFSTISESYSGSQESAIMNAYVGKAAAACTWPMPWDLLLAERPELAKELKVLWRTEPLVNNAIVANDRVPKEHVDEIMAVLLSLPNSQAGRDALKRLSLTAFEEIDPAVYVSKVENFLKQYKKEFPGDGTAAIPNLAQ